jgi:predicted ATPase
MTAAETSRERWYEAEVYRVAGEIELLSPTADLAKAAEHFEHALAIARAQQAKSWELRAAISLARLWREEGKRQQAHDCLAPLYGWFTEGFDTLDLREAKALLDAISSEGDRSDGLAAGSRRRGSLRARSGAREARTLAVNPGRD